MYMDPVYWKKRGLSEESFDGKEGEQPFHGGDIYHHPGVMDFSVNINPLPLPEEVRRMIAGSMACLDRYPDPESHSLRKEIALLEQTGPEQVIPGNGASELFFAIAHAFRPRTAVVVSPCYGGYAYALGAVGCTIKEVSLAPPNFDLTEEILDVLTEEVDMIFLAQPNNPTGRPIREELLDKIAWRCREQGILLVLDDCFSYLAGQKPPLSRHAGAILVAAFTKVLALPGLRIGYALTDIPEYAVRIRKQLPEWNVSVPAQEIGTAAAKALRQTDYLKETNLRIREEKTRLSEELRACGLAVAPGEANFLLVQSRVPLAEPLLQQGFLVRDCASFAGLDHSYIRIAIRTPEEDQKLMQAIRRVLS